ncbi:MAG: acyl-CoA/acyl-ACP dehydrogenase [Dehalococcoidia bacterium]|nr:acyl-CoA/acyl-ACP dehydrogenase [Dehalococcoidia bacterium]
MNIAFTEEQEMLRTSARDFVEKECPARLVRQIEESEGGYSPELWRKMADLGWMGLVIPEEYGGVGGSFLDLLLLIEEMGRGCLPGPFLSTLVLGALPIMAAGTAEQKEEFLPKIAQGEMILALALTEPSARWDAASIAVGAVSEKEQYIINGTKLFIEYAHIADYLLCVARTKDAPTGRGEDGLSLFLVDARSPGLKCTPFKTIGSVPQCEVVFDNVVVPAKNMLGERDRGWPVVKDMLERGAIAKCAESIGGARQVVEMTVAYAKERVAYGRTIASFQTVQHMCVSMLSYADTARNITYEAAWRLSEGLPCAKQVASAKAWASEAYERITKMGAHLHGAIGFTRDHDLGLYYRRAKAATLAFGDPDHQREVVAREIGL